MLDNITLSKTLAAPHQHVWAAISSIGGLDRWFPIISQCRVEGEGAGALRVMVLADGADMVDRIDEVNHDQHIVRYTRIVLPFPASHYQGKVEVLPLDGKQSLLHWTLHFEVTEEKRLEVNSLVASAISNGLCGLEKELLAMC